MLEFQLLVDAYRINPDDVFKVWANFFRDCDRKNVRQYLEASEWTVILMSIKFEANV